MTTKLTLTGKSDGVEPNEDGVLVVPDGTAVVLTVSADSALDPTKVTLSRDGETLPNTFTAADGKSATATVTAAGAYQATHEDGSKSNTFTVSAQAANGDGGGGGGGGGDGGDGEPEAVVETGFGVLDKPFLWGTMLAALVGVAAVFVLFARQVRFLNNLTSAWSDESFAVRSAAEIQWTVAGAGTGLLVIGAWLAALETRGRLKEPTPEQPVPGTRGFGTEIGNALGGAIEKLRKARGTIAVLIAGTILLLAVLWASTSVANHEDTDTTEPEVTTTESAVTSQTASPVADPARPTPTAP